MSSTCVLDTSQSPSAKLHSVPLGAVRWTSGFWHGRVQQAAETMIRFLWERLADPAAGHVLANFEIAAGRREGPVKCTWWQDAWLYKWLEAAACLHHVSPDPWLVDRMDLAIELIGAAQADDGYLWTYLANPDLERFTDPRHHEVYVMGHLLTAAVTHRRLTGQTSFFELGVKVGDFLAEVLGKSVPSYFAHNPSAVMGLVELHRETGEQRYLDCAQRVVDDRGSQPKRGWDLWHREHGLNGGDQIQDRIPLREATEVVGHNVFFTYLFAGAADVWLETGEDELKAALDRMWDDLVTGKMNVNGGVSPMGHGLSIHHDTVVEAVGPKYFLPHEDCYNETCGQVGMMLWAQRLLLGDPQAKYAELVEHELYNGVLSGVGLDGRSFWYRNQLRRSEPGGAGPGHNDLPAREAPGERRICCPTNILRTLAMWQSYAWSTDAEGVWLHQYGSMAVDLGLWACEVETDYPWDGQVKLTVKAAPTAELALRLRIPSWAAGATAKVNGVAVTVLPGEYLEFRRVWSAGDVVELDFPLEVRLVEAHPRVEQCRNQLAVMRGPVLYCLESPELPNGVEVADVYLPGQPELEPVEHEELPFGLRVLRGQLLRRETRDWSGQLYQSLPAAGFEPVETCLIPYFGWANRGPSAMSVWLPVAWGVTGDEGLG